MRFQSNNDYRKARKCNVIFLFSLFVFIIKVSRTKNIFSPHEILYVDKTGRETVQTKPSKTPVKCGSKQEGIVNTAERAVLSAARFVCKKEEI